VRSAEIQNDRYDKGMQVKYSVRGDDEPTETTMVVKGGCMPQFSHSRVVSLPCVVEEHLEYFDTGCITFLVYARQVDSPPDKRLQKMSTRVRTLHCWLITSAPPPSVGGRSVAISVSVCPLAYLNNHTSRQTASTDYYPPLLQSNFVLLLDFPVFGDRESYPWLWLCPPLTAMQYVMYFRFCG